MIDLGFVLTLGVFLAVVSIHELGHYGVGRWLVGIPSSDIRIVLLSLPAHVALRDGQEWISPFDDRYGELYYQHDPDGTYLEAYIGGGTLGQTVGVVAIVGVLVALGYHGAADTFLAASIILVGIYLVYDAVHAAYAGRPIGDFSTLWQRSPIATIAVLLCFAVPHGALYLLL